MALSRSATIPLPAEALTEYAEPGLVYRRPRSGDRVCLYGGHFLSASETWTAIPVRADDAPHPIPAADGGTFTVGMCTTCAMRHYD